MPPQSYFADFCQLKLQFSVKAAESQVGCRTLISAHLKPKNRLVSKLLIVKKRADRLMSWGRELGAGLFLCVIFY